MSYRQLIVWQKAMAMVNVVYEATCAFPRAEIYGLANQMRRAAVSVPSNIAEGQGRRSPKEFMHHLRIAYGSLMELETQTIIARNQHYISPEQATELLDQTAEVGRLINGTLRSVASSQSSVISNPN